MTALEVPATGQARERTRLLVVEDNLNYRRTLINILEKEGYAVVGVPDGKVALEEAQKEDFAVVIADLRLPGMNGIETLKEINVLSPNTESLVLTAYPSDDSLKRATDFGAYAYLSKAEDIDHTMMLIRKAVELYEARQELEKLRRLTQELGEGPTGNPDGDEFKLKMTEWRGYVTRALQDVDKRLEHLDKDVGNVVTMIRQGDEKMVTMIGKVDDKVGAVQIKVAAMAGTAGVLTAIITSIILSKMGG